MRADPALLSREARQRLVDRVRELDQLAELMRQPGGLAAVPEPPPLHQIKEPGSE